MKRWIRCVLDFVMLVVFSMICAQTVMATETGTTTEPFQQDVIKPGTEIDIVEETEPEASKVLYRIVLDDMIEGAQVECPDQAAAGEPVPVLLKADEDHSIRSVVAHYYDASFEGHQIEMDPLVEDEDGVHYEFIMPDADVAVFVMTEVLNDVTVLESDGGTVIASRDRAGFNDSVALTAEPEEGYQFVSWEVYEKSGSQISVQSDDTFFMGFEAVTVRAIFEKLKVDYSITLTQSGEGTIVSSGERANAGETVTVTPSAQSGYRLQRITVTANTPGAGVVLEDTEEKESYSFTMPEGDVTVHVQFDKITDHVVRVISDDKQHIVQLNTDTNELALYEPATGYPPNHGGNQRESQDDGDDAPAPLTVQADNSPVDAGSETGFSFTEILRLLLLQMLGFSWN